MSPRRALVIVALSTLLSMSAWFSASFVITQLSSDWRLSTGESSLLTIAVQVGFVCGALVSAITGLADAVQGRLLMCAGAVGASAANLALITSSGLMQALPLRFFTGFCLAAVYPPALKLVSTWFRVGRGTAIGTMIGALTLGSAIPHLVNVFGNLDWHVVIVATSVLAGLGGPLVLWVGEGPHPFPPRHFSARAALGSFTRRDVMLANLGYMGHMWELYAMWAGCGAFIASLPAVAASADAQRLASGLAFACIGVGVFGCYVGGMLGDRLGRAQSALICLICSGSSVSALSLMFDVMPAPAIVALCACWGFWVIADSAQFSAMVTERADPDCVGSAVSIQLALGYLTTLVTLWLVPRLVEQASWHLALCVLIPGPVLGALAMVGIIRGDRRQAFHLAA